MRRFTLALAFALALALRMAAQSERADDVIRRKNGEISGVRVVKETWDRVVYRFPGTSSDQEVPRSEVVEVVYGDSPFDFEQARQAEATGDFAAAAARYEKSVRRCPPPLIQHALYKQARCLERAGQIQAADAAYAALRTQAPDSRFLQAAWERSIDLRSRLGTLAGLALAPPPGRAPAWWPLVTARLQERRGQYAQALDAYRKLTDFRDEADRSTAMAGELRCLCALDRHAEAATVAAKATAESSPAALRAEAWIALGEEAAARAAKGGTESAAAWKDALLHYLHVVVLYVPVEAEPTDPRERALARAGRCLEELARMARDDESRASCRGRALGLRQELLRDHPYSVWAVADR